MAIEHVFDEAFPDSPIGCRRGARSVAQHDVIHQGKCCDQFRAGLLAQQRLDWIGHFHHQKPAGRGVPAKAPHVLGQQRVKVAGNPMAVATQQFFAGLGVRVYFSPCIQDA